MSQHDILKVLRKLKENEWISTGKLVKKVKIGRSTIHSNLKKLRNSNDVVSRRRRGNWRNIELEHKLYHGENDYEP